MKYADEKGTKTQQWFPNELCMDIDLNRLSIQRYQNFTDMLLALMYQDTIDSVLNGLHLYINTLLTCNLKTGVALSFSGAYASDGVWGFVAMAGDSFSVVVPDDTAIAFNTADPTNPRIDVLEIRPIEIPYNSGSRNFKDPVTELVNTAVINTSLEYGFEFQILEGTPAGSPSAPAKTAGWIKLAEVSVAAAQTTLTQDDIKDVRDSDTWTTEVDTTILKRFAEALEADLALNDTDEGASKIGIEDVGGNYTATDIEGALAEKGILVNQDVKTTASPAFVGLTFNGAKLAGIHVPILLREFADVSGDSFGLAYDPNTGNLISCDTGTNTIYIHDGISGAILSSFATPSSNPTGVAVDGSGNLISCDNGTALIYIHSGITSSVSSSFAGATTGIIGIDVDLSTGNLLSIYTGNDNVYIHDGITVTTTDNFSTPGTNVSGIALDQNSGNLLTCDVDTDLVYIYEGISSTVIKEWDLVANPTGLVVNQDTEDLISCNNVTNNLYIYAKILVGF